MKLYRKLTLSIALTASIALAFSFSVHGAVASPSSDNFQRSGIKWYKAETFLSATGSLMNTYALYNAKNPSSGFMFEPVGSSFYDNINFGQILTSAEMSTIATAQWWAVTQNEYYGWVYDGVTSSYVPNNTFVIFWFASYLPMNALDQLEIWINTETIVSRTPYQDTIFKETATLEPFLYTVPDVNNINFGWSMSNSMSLISLSSTEWGLYRSAPVTEDCYVLGIGFRMTDEYANAVPSGYWLDVDIMFSSAFVGRIDDYFNGIFVPEADYVPPTKPLPPVYEDVGQAESAALDNLDDVLNDLDYIGNLADVESGRIHVMDIFEQVLDMSFLSIIGAVVTATLIIRAVVGR